MSAILQALYLTVVMKRDLGWKGKLLINQLIYVPPLIYGRERKDETVSTSGRNKFPRQVAELSHRDGVRNSDNWRELRVET